MGMLGSVEGSESLEIREGTNLYGYTWEPKDCRSANGLSSFVVLRGLRALRYIVDKFRLFGMNCDAGLSRLVCWGRFTVSVLGDLAVGGWGAGLGISMRDLPRTTMRLG